MPTVKPIKKELLIHNVKLRTYAGDDGDKPGTEAEVDLLNVKIDKALQYKIVDGRYEVVGSALMFVDAVNSVIDNGIDEPRAPLSSDLLVDTEVVFQGKTYTVRDPDELSADNKGNKIHHWEVVLK